MIVMTREELNEVRDLKKTITNAEQALEMWRRAEALKIPFYDGLPKAKNPNCSVERLAIEIADASKHIDDLKERLEIAIPRLKQKICDAVQDSNIRVLLILRYVEDMYFRDIGFAMNYSEQHIYYLHNKAMEMLKIKS